MPLPALTFQPPLIAHRGARIRAPENTLAALQLAHEEGATWAEVDVKLTHDGVPVLMHDDRLDRTTNGKGNVADITWAEMQTLDAGSWFSPQFKGERVPRLAEALRLALASGLRLNLEIKPCPGRTRATAMVALMEAAQIWPAGYPPPLISSFDIETLAIAAQFQPQWPRGLLLDEWRPDWRNIATQVGAETLNVNAAMLNAERFRDFEQARLPILAFTVNDPALAKDLLNKGVGAVFTDNPREILEAL